jgi:hypothetical protein
MPKSRKLVYQSMNLFEIQADSDTGFFYYLNPGQLRPLLQLKLFGVIMINFFLT